MKIAIYVTTKTKDTYSLLTDKNITDERFHVVETRRADVPEVVYEMVADYRVLVQLPLYLNQTGVVFNTNVKGIIIFALDTR